MHKACAAWIYSYWGPDSPPSSLVAPWGQSYAFLTLETPNLVQNLAHWRLSINPVSVEWMNESLMHILASWFLIPVLKWGSGEAVRVQALKSGKPGLNVSFWPKNLASLCLFFFFPSSCKIVKQQSLLQRIVMGIKWVNRMLVKFVKYCLAPNKYVINATHFIISILFFFFFLNCNRLQHQAKKLSYPTINLRITL